MNSYEQKKCEVCRVDAPPVDPNELDAFLRTHNDWTVKGVDRIPQLARVFSFANFPEALQFTNRVSELAEKEGHHPIFPVEGGRVTVRWWT